MPTVLRVGPYRFVFFSTDRAEPPHVHVLRDRWMAKFWLAPVSLSKHKGFPAPELNHVGRLVVEHEHALLEAWHDYFGS